MAVAPARPADEVADDVADAAPSPSRRAQLLLAWLLSIVLVLSLAGAALVVLMLRAQDNRADNRAELLRAGRQLVVDFSTYDYQTWQADAQRVLDGATGRFKEEFSTTAAQVEASVVANKATSQGEVLEAAVVSMDDDSAQVLVVADAKITNTALKNGQLRHYRIKLEMVREDDRWRAAELQAVG